MWENDIAKIKVRLKAEPNKAVANQTGHGKNK